MAATAGSPYQALRAKHVAGSPPNSDPQRSNESFEVYSARMAGLYLKPDIDADESDSDYLTRLATYLPVVAPVSASYSTYAVSTLSASYAVTSSRAISGVSSSYALSALSASYAPVV